MDSGKLHTEEQLLLLISNGDQKAFSQIIRHYSPIIYRQLLSVLRDVQQVQEIGQDIFLVIWHNREKLPEISNFGAYLRVTARNAAIKAIKNNIHQGGQPQEDEIQLLLDTPYTALEVKDLKRVLEEGINKLPRSLQR